MRPGPRPEPLEARRLRGNPSRRPIPDAPGPLQGDLVCPPHLKGVAGAMWRQAASWLAAAGTAGPECATVLERYAVTYSRWRAAEAELARTGLMLEAAGTGTPYPSPWLYVSRAEGDRLGRLEAELGLTPSSRGRVTRAATTPDPDSVWGRLRELQGR